MTLNPANAFYLDGNRRFQELINRLKNEGRTQRTAVGDILLKEGDACEFFFYIEYGVFRTFRYHLNKEVTLGFTFRGDLDTCPYSYFNNMPSLDTIQSLREGRVIKIFKEQFDQLDYDRESKIEFLLYMQSTYIETLLRRTLDYNTRTAESRYMNLMQSQPQDLDLIPLQYLASYLGISSERLSRIRKKLKN